MASKSESARRHGACGRRRRAAATAGTVVLLLALSPTSAGAEGPAASGTQRVTASTDGGPLSGPGDEPDTRDPVVSADGRFVAFESDATNLSDDDLDATSDVYVVDRLFGTTELISVSSAEVAADGDSEEPAMSADGRYVAFTSEAANLVAGDGNGDLDVFVRDRLAGTTERISVDSAEVEGTEHSDDPDISADGSLVTFVSNGSFVAGDTNARQDAYLRDREAGTTERVSLTSTDGQSADSVYSAEISGDASTVVFTADGADVVPGDTNGEYDVFARHLAAGTTERVSITPTGGEYPDGVAVDDFSVSHDGDVVAFEGQRPSETVVAVRDLSTDTTTRLSPVGKDGSSPSISDDGERITFTNTDPDSEDATLVVVDRSDTSVLALFARHDGAARGADMEIAGDGRHVVIASLQVLGPDGPGDTPFEEDVYIDALADDTFDDVPTPHGFFEEISWLVDSGITTGFSDDTYRPTIPVSRQAIAAFLYRSLGEPAFTPPGTATFGDVPTSHAFFHEIEWAVSVGMVNGYPDGTFRPTVAVTRQSMAAFMYRLAGEPAFAPPDPPTFDDVGVAHPFLVPVEWLASVGLARGFADGGFHPGAPVSRQAAAAFLFRLDWLGLTSPP
jgi:hypothetical protein